MTNSGPKQENLLELERHVAPYFCTWFVLNYTARPRENIGQHAGSCGYLIAAEVHRQLTSCVCVCVIVCTGGGSGPTPAGGWRCGQWELSSCPVRMCPGGGGQFSFLFLFVCLSVWLHKQMGADILISTGKHSRFSLCRDMTSTGNRKSPASSLWGHSAVGVPRAWGM